MGLINDLGEAQGSSTSQPMVCYFFCQNTDNRYNSAVAIVKGLIAQLVSVDRTQIAHLRKHWDDEKEAFKKDPDVESLETLWEILLKMLDSITSTTKQRIYVVVDAVDECGDGRKQFLRRVARSGTSISPRVKWLFTSRPLDHPERFLHDASGFPTINLEDNRISLTSAIKTFINHKVDELCRTRKYDDIPRGPLASGLEARAGNTFLWVALVCQQLEDVPSEEILTAAVRFPSGLDSFYARMIQEIHDRDEVTARLCNQLIMAATLAERPLHVREASHIAGYPHDERRKATSVRRIVDSCKSLLALQDDDCVHFVHLSAKDYINSKISPSELPKKHECIAKQCLELMIERLDKNMGELPSVSTHVSELREGKRKDLLAEIGYACRFWMEHLIRSYESYGVGSGLPDATSLDQFFTSKLLHWLEAISILGNIPESVLLLQRLKRAVDVRKPMTFLVKALSADTQ